MTPEQEADLIEDMAAEICYAVFVPPIDYGGPARYWRGVVKSQKEGYRREARAALRIAKPVIRDEAIREHLEVVEDLPAPFDEWRLANAEIFKIGTLTSLLYDINLLPEQVLTFKSIKMLRYLVAVVEHFKMARNEALEEAAGMVAESYEGACYEGISRFISADIRALKSKGQKP